MASTSSSWLPEESFQTWSNYTHALLSTPSRLKNRFLTRTLPSQELTDMPIRSTHAFKKNLSAWDLIWFGIGAVVGAGIFVITGVEAKDHVGPAIIISYAIAGFAAMLSVFCYTEFAVEIPVAGGSFAYLRVELGEFVAFIGAGNIILEYVIGGAAVARAWTSYFSSLVFSGTNVSERLRIRTGLAEGYNMLDPMAVGVLVVAGVIAMWSTKGTSYVNWIASVVNMFIIAFVVVAGLAHAEVKNLTTGFLHFGVRGIFSASSVLFFAYLGFDAVSTLAEEVKNPARDIPIGLIGSMLLCTLIYMLMALTLTLMVPYTLIDTGAPFSVAFATVGMPWAKYIVALGALKGITTVLLVGAVGQARYLTHIARSHLIPPWFAKVNKYTQTPINATVTMIVTSSIVAFFTDLPILGSLLSMSSLFMFFLVSVALLVRRYYVPNQTSVRHGTLFSIYLSTIVTSSIGIAACWGMNVAGWVCYAILGSVWFVATLAMAVSLKQLREPKTWGVPLVPWIPALSIGFTMLLLGSLDRASFVRFGMWTGVMMVYYILFGLHASFDAAKEIGGGEVDGKKMSEGERGAVTGGGPVGVVLD